MQQFVGSILKIIGAMALVGTALWMVLGGAYGLWEAATLDGASKYGALFFVLRLAGISALFGATSYYSGRWLVKTAPPLEESKLPFDPGSGH